MLHQKKVGWGDLLVIILHRLASNPLVIAMLISLLVILTDIEIPDFVTNTIYFIAKSGIGMFICYWRYSLGYH